MNSLTAQGLLDQVDYSINEILSFAPLSPAQEAYFAKYLTVYISGIIEESIETMINEMVIKNSSPEIAKYVNSNLEFFRNPKTEKIARLMGQFNTSWKKRIESLPLKNKTALDSIVDNKNLIAHGRSSTITMADITKYYSDAKLIVVTVDSLLV